MKISVMPMGNVLMFAPLMFLKSWRANQKPYGLQIASNAVLVLMHAPQRQLNIVPVDTLEDEHEKSQGFDGNPGRTRA